MSHILTEYFIFILKIITVIIFPLTIILIIKKNTDKNTTITFSNINDKFNLLKTSTYKKINNKNDYKKKIKELKQLNHLFKKTIKSNLFIINFDGDISAKETTKLKDIISLILLVIKKNDEILIKLNSSGGFVNNYGLAAAQLQRLKKRNITLTISIDLIAASGGYLMAAVANKIIAAPFAIIGSIGVIGILPNFNKFLEKHDIEIEHHTAGEHKSTLNIFSKNTDQGRKKFIQTLEQTHLLFKNFIFKNRPKININEVCTGEYWYAKDAIKLKLIDKIQTSDEYILNKINKKNIYEINIKDTTFKNKINEHIKNILLKFINQ